MRDSILSAIADYVAAPAYMRAIAGACRYDLLHGPSWSAIPREGLQAFNSDCVASLREDLEEMESEGADVDETYTGAVGEALRAFIDDLPSELWVDDEWGAVMESEPEGQWVDPETFEPSEDEGAVYDEPAPCYVVGRRQIVEAVFGSTISREFS